MQSRFCLVALGATILSVLAACELGRSTRGTPEESGSDKMESLPPCACVIKAAPTECGAAYRVIVETTPDGRTMYLMPPMTNRVMPLDVVPEDRVFTHLTALASAIAALPENSSVYAANVRSFAAGNRSIRSPTDAEVAEIRRLLEAKAP